VDDYVVNVGRSDDGTLDLIRSIENPKIRIFETVWDETLRRDGLIFSQQTNLALAHCAGDWAFYLQADEVVHEDDIASIVRSLERVHHRREVLGLLFRFLHFKVDYWSTIPGPTTGRSASYATMGGSAPLAMPAGSGALMILSSET